MALHSSEKIIIGFNIEMVTKLINNKIYLLHKLYEKSVLIKKNIIHS